MILWRSSSLQSSIGLRLIWSISRFNIAPMISDLLQKGLNHFLVSIIFFFCRLSVAQYFEACWTNELIISRAIFLIANRMHGYLFTAAAKQVVLAFQLNKLIALKAIKNLILLIVIFSFLIFDFHFNFVSLEISFEYFIELLFAIWTSI